MSSLSELITELDLMAYADDRLDPARRREVHAFLAAHPDLMVKVAAMVRQNEAIRDELDAVLSEPVPERLLGFMTESRRGGLRVARIAAVLALALMTGAAGWVAGRTARAPADDGIPGYVAAVTSADGPGSPSADLLSAPSTGEVLPLEWLAGRATLEIPAPDLHAHGYENAATDLVEIDGRPTLRFGFRRTDGAVAVLYLAPKRDTAPPVFHVRNDGGAASVHWSDGPLVWVLTGDADATELETLARTIHDGVRLEPGAGDAMPVQNAMDVSAPLPDPVAGLR